MSERTAQSAPKSWRREARGFTIADWMAWLLLKAQILFVLAAAIAAVAVVGHFVTASAELPKWATNPRPNYGSGS